MSKEGSKEKVFKIDPQLQYVFRRVGYGVCERIGTSLQEKGLIDADWNPRGDFTEEGVEVLVKNIVTGVGIALARARVEIPLGYAVEQIGLADNMLEGFGNLDVRENGNDLKIEFSGKGALVKSITTPLDIDKALRSIPEDNPDICHVEIGKRPRIRGTHVVDFPEPEHEV